MTRAGRGEPHNAHTQVLRFVSRETFASVCVTRSAINCRVLSVAVPLPSARTAAATRPSRNQPTKSTSRTDSPNPRKIAVAVAELQFHRVRARSANGDQDQENRAHRGFSATSLDSQKVPECCLVVCLTTRTVGKP